MASSKKHKVRSSKTRMKNSIPVSMFMNNAIKRAEARERILRGKIDLTNQSTDIIN